MSKSSPLRLLAQDPEDLKVISAALQDAAGKMGDISYDPRARRLTLILNRYRWEAPRAKERVRAALQLGGVLSVQGRRLRREAPRAVVALLAVNFEPVTAPGGMVTLTFAGGGDLRVEVECLDVVLADVSAAWAAKSAPEHG